MTADNVVERLTPRSGGRAWSRPLLYFAAARLDHEAWMGDGVAGTISGPERGRRPSSPPPVAAAVHQGCLDRLTAAHDSARL